MTKILYIYSFLFLANCFSQQKLSFFTKKETKELTKKIKVNANKKISSCSKKTNKKELKNSVKNLVKYFNNSLIDSSYVKNDFFDTKIKKIVAAIYSANPELKQANTYFLISNDFEPNAFCYGINVYEITLGLFALLENDDELAFVICHEMAHQQLSHLEKGIFNKQEELKNIKSETKRVKKLDISRSDEATKVFKNIAYNIAKKTKVFEEEADQLGLKFFNKTNYEKTAPVSVLTKLGLTEETLYSYKIDWKKTFGVDYKGYVNKNKMFKRRVIDEQYTIYKDSLRTHPNTDIRINRLLSNSTKSNTKKNNVKHFLTPQQIKAYECLINYKKLAKTFYISSILYEKSSNKQPYINILSNVIDKTCYYKKKHSLGKYMNSLIDNYSKEKIYNDIVHFFNEANLKELNKIKEYINK